MSQTRIAARPRPASRGATLPLAARLLLVASIVALGAVVFTTATGGLGRLVGALGSGIGGVLDELTATATPAPTELLVADAPLIASPAQPYTNEPAVDLLVTVPPEVVGRQDAVVRIYLTLTGQPTAPIDEVPVGAAPQLTVPVTLTDGPNDFTATVVGPGGESDPSPVVTWILDTEAPGIAIHRPKNRATIEDAATEIVGRTQAGTTIIARNEANNASATAVAGDEGDFSLSLPIAHGSNGIVLTATDPAGNVAETVLTVRRGSGALSASLSTSVVRVSAKRLPVPVTLTVEVTDPAGRPLEGASVTFTLSIPGVPVVTADAVTAGDGTAVFRTTVPDGATVGSGLATVLVTSDPFGDVSDRAAITVTK